MRGVFDEEEEQERSRQGRDTELTLGSGMLLALFFALVLLCGLCFGMGYAVGHRGSAPPAAAAAQPAPEQEPLQASGSIPKPSAIAQTPVTPADDQAQAGTGASAQASPEGAGAAAANAPGSPVHPALAAASPQQSAAAMPQAVHPAFAAPPLMVQIAAVSNPDDAEVLVNALRQRNYPVTVRRDPSDNYIHVRIGPFATRAQAEQWKAKLLNDGYNAVIQP